MKVYPIGMTTQNIEKMRKLNKKGQLEFLLIILFIIGVLFAVGKSANSYESYKDDCYKVSKQNFMYNTTCSYTNWSCVIDGCEPHIAPCQKIDKTNLEEYCFNQYSEKIS